MPSSRPSSPYREPQVICCDLPHGESSGTSSQEDELSPEGCEGDVELDPTDSCCFDFVQPCDSPDCEDDTICDDEECVISLSVPPCAGCGEARLERRSSSSRMPVTDTPEGEGREGDDHVLVQDGQGQVLECSCGFQDSWECTLDGTDFGQFDQYLDCCHPSYTPFPQLPIDLMGPSSTPDAFSEPRETTYESTVASAFNSPSIQSEPSSERLLDMLPSSDSSGSLPPPALPLPPSASDDLYSNFSVLLDAALSSTTNNPTSPANDVPPFRQPAFPTHPDYSQQPSPLDTFLSSTDSAQLSPATTNGFFNGGLQTSSPLHSQSPVSSIEPSSLNCEWSNCNESFPTLDQLVEHFRSTSSHLPTVPEQQPFVFGAPPSHDSSLPSLVAQQPPSAAPVSALTCQWGSDPHLLSVAADMVRQENEAGHGAGAGAAELSPSEILLQHLLRDHLAGPLPLPPPQSSAGMGLPQMGTMAPPPPPTNMASFGEQLHLNSSPSTGSAGIFSQDYRDSPGSDFSFNAKQEFPLVPPPFGSSTGSTSDSASISSSSQHPQPHHHHGHLHPHPYHRPHDHHSHAHLHSHGHQHGHPPHVHVHHLHPHPHPHVHTHHPGHHHAHVHHPKIITASHRRSNSTASSVAGVPSIHACGYTGCTEVFEDTTTLTEHINKVHVGSGKESYTCGWEGCERGLNGPIFKSKQKIMRHIQAHTGHKPFVCPTCSQTFSEAATLAQHQRRHTNEKPFVCDHPGCTKAFTLVASLTIHKRTHDGIKPFACPHCDRAFVEASNLTKHIRTHTGDKPFGCGKCEKRFARPDQLSRHQSVHARKEAAAAAAALGEAGAGAAGLEGGDGMGMGMEVEA